MQTQHLNNQTISSFKFIHYIMKRNGIRGFYQGLSAQIMRQLTYSTARFGIYEVAKERYRPNTVLERVLLASVSGTIGGFIGTPFELVNMRMQNDLKMPPNMRRNYKNVFDGLYRIYREEGFRKLFTGVASSSTKADIVTVGQIALYEQVKGRLLTKDFKDEVYTHFLVAIFVGFVSITLIQPLDVIKARIMSARGNYRSLSVCNIVTCSGQLGPLAFFRGYIPAFLRFGPHTVITLVVLEQLRLRYGIDGEDWQVFEDVPRLF